MLTEAQLSRRRGRRRAATSPQQLYQAYLVHRIEAFKNSKSRQELMLLADEAMAADGAGAEGQLFLTEVMVLDCVDRLISRRLRLPTFRSWKQRYGKLRASQQEPAYWGVSPTHPVATLLPRCEPGDRALLIGGGTELLAPLLAAHDLSVTFLAGALPVVERVERRTTEEALAGQVDAFVVQVGRPWLPPAEGPLQLVVIDAGEVAALPGSDLRPLMVELQGRLGGVGAHVLIGPSARVAGMNEWYREWQQSKGEEGTVYFPVACQNDSPDAASLQHTLLDARD